MASLRVAPHRGDLRPLRPGRSLGVAHVPLPRRILVAGDFPHVLPALDLGPPAPVGPAPLSALPPARHRGPALYRHPRTDRTDGLLDPLAQRHEPHPRNPHHP